VLYAEQDGYRFSSAAVREALLASMEDPRREANHKRLGEAFAKLAGDDKPRLVIEAGWHLIRGGAEEQGADLIASAMHDATGRDLMANLHRIGHPVEAALKVYGKYRRSLYERLPLLATLAQAGYYEARGWGETYGDEALTVGEWLSGVATVRHLRRFIGGWLALVVGVTWAWVRFRLAPARERRYSFRDLMTHFLATVTTLAGVAALSFDAERCDRIADTLEPFAVLPARATPVGVYSFCCAMREIPRENQAVAFDAAEELLRRFQDPRYYPSLPTEARKFYIAGAHLVRGTFGTFRADGRGTLESADALDRTGLKLYAMMASQLRCLYFTMRGDFAKAAVHRDRVEIHAAHVGSVWQVETWEAAALLLVYPMTGDVVASTRLAHRLERLSKVVPTLKHNAALAREAVLLVRGDPTSRPLVVRHIEEHLQLAPRSHNGWAGAMGYIARGHNQSGDPAAAKAVCEQALLHVTDADRDYILNFMNLDVELGRAEAALGRPEDGLKRVEALLARHAKSGHALGLGLLHEAHGAIAWAAGKADAYAADLREMERLFLPTEDPALIARCRRLAELSDPSRVRGHGASRPPAALPSPDRRLVATPDQLAKTAIVGRSKPS
jgi:hypothetical protein